MLQKDSHKLVKDDDIYCATLSTSYTTKNVNRLRLCELTNHQVSIRLVSHELVFCDGALCVGIWHTGDVHLGHNGTVPQFTRGLKNCGSLSKLTNKINHRHSTTAWAAPLTVLWNNLWKSFASDCSHMIEYICSQITSMVHHAIWGTLGGISNWMEHYGTVCGIIVTWKYPNQVMAHHHEKLGRCETSLKMFPQNVDQPEAALPTDKSQS